jgi:hypothetical protein
MGRLTVLNKYNYYNDSGYVRVVRNRYQLCAL